MSKAGAHPAVSSGPLKNKLKAALGMGPSVPLQKGIFELRASLRESSFCSMDDIVVYGIAETGVSDYVWFRVRVSPVMESVHTFTRFITYTSVV